MKNKIIDYATEAENSEIEGLCDRFEWTYCCGGENEWVKDTKKLNSLIGTLETRRQEKQGCTQGDCFPRDTGCNAGEDSVKDCPHSRTYSDTSVELPAAPKKMKVDWIEDGVKKSATVTLSKGDILSQNYSTAPLIDIDPDKYEGVVLAQPDKSGYYLTKDITNGLWIMVRYSIEEIYNTFTEFGWDTPCNVDDYCKEWIFIMSLLRRKDA